MSSRIHLIKSNIIEHIIMDNTVPIVENFKLIVEKEIRIITSFWIQEKENEKNKGNNYLRNDVSCLSIRVCYILFCFTFLIQSKFQRTRLLEAFLKYEMKNLHKMFQSEKEQFISQKRNH